MAALAVGGRLVLRALCVGQIAFVGHGGRTLRAAVTFHVHREDVVAGLGQVGHPAIGGMGYVEAHFGGGARAMDEQHQLVRVRLGAGANAFAQIEPHGPPLRRRRGRNDIGGVIDTEDAGVGLRQGGRSRQR